MLERKFDVLPDELAAFFHNYVLVRDALVLEFLAQWQLSSQITVAAGFDDGSSGFDRHLNHQGLPVRQGWPERDDDLGVGESQFRRQQRLKRDDDIVVGRLVLVRGKTRDVSLDDK